MEDDVDLFVTSLSPLLDEDIIRAKAYENGWSVGQTELGTPALIVHVDDVDIRVDLYENIHDFYIPSEALDACRRSITVEGVNIVFVAPECWAVFKAKRGANKDMYDLSVLKSLVDRGDLELDISLIKKVAELYEDETRFIFDRLRSVGFKL